MPGANLGVLLFFQGNYAEAIPQMRAALQLQPDLWKIEALLGIAEKRTRGSANSANQSGACIFKPGRKKKSEIFDAGSGTPIELESAAAQFDKKLSPWR